MTSLAPVRTTAPWLRGLVALTAVTLTVYVVSTLPGVRPEPGFRPLLDGLLQGGGYVLVAVLCAVGAATRAGNRLVWWLVTASVACRALAFVLTLLFRVLDRPLPFPSVADVLWVASALLLIGAVLRRLQELSLRLTRLVALDGLAVVLLVLGVAVSVLAGPVEVLAAPGTPADAVLVNLTYPVLDTALLVAASYLVTAVRSRLRLADRLLLAGIVGFVVVDVVYLVLLSEGLWRPGTLVSALSLVTTAVIATAVWAAPALDATPERRPGQPAAVVTVPGVSVCASLVVASLLMLVVSEIVGAPPAVLLLYGAAGAVAVTRGVMTLRGDRERADLLLGEANLDLLRFQALVEASNDLIGIADTSGTVLYLNPGGRRLLGLSREQDLGGMKVSDVVPGAGEASFETRWPQILASGSWEGESELAPPGSDERIPMAISTFVIRDPRTGTPFALATIQRDLRDRIAQEEALRDLADQRARLLTRLVEAQEEERARIAADVHDDPVQAMAVVDLRLSVLRRRVARESPDLVEQVEGVQEVVTQATERLRHLLFDLESPARELPLVDALEHAASFVFAETDVDVRVDGERDLGLSEAERITAYRIALEALVNACKHAGADHVTVRLHRDPDEVVVRVSDDGRGIDPGDERDRPGHRGLTSMRERAEVAGGVLDVVRRPEGGTEVRLTLPTHG